MQAVLVFLPVDPPVWAQQFTRWALARSVAYFPTTMHVEEELRVGRPYVVGAHRASSERAQAHTRSLTCRLGQVSIHARRKHVSR